MEKKQSKKILKFIENYNLFLKNSYKKIDIFYERIFFNILTPIFNLGYKINKILVYLFLFFYTPIRYFTIPLNKIWIFFWLKERDRNQNIEPLDFEGVHYINAPMGGGKSSIAFAKAKDNLYRTGKGSYISTKLEKIKEDDFGLQYYNHRFFDFSEFWADGKEIKKMNTNYCDQIIFDEIHYFFNNRNNKSKAYNEVMIGIINSTIMMRHDGIKRIYYLSQQPAMDNQIMNIARYMHEVKAIKEFDYAYWIHTGNFKKAYRLTKWRIKTYTRSQNGDYLLFRTWIKKNNYRNDYLIDFNTLNMSHRNDNLETDYINTKERY